MIADILSRVIGFGLSKKLEKLEQSAIQHCSEIDFCSGLVDEINSKFKLILNRIV